MVKASKQIQEVADSLIEQYNNMASHGGTELFVIPKADLQVILTALGQKVKIVET